MGVTKNPPSSSSSPGKSPEVIALENLTAAIGDEVKQGFMLTKEPNSSVLFKQIADEASSKLNVSAGKIYDLYVLNVTSSQITSLLTKNKNAQELHAQIDSESSKRADKILALYEIGASSDEITGLLAKNSDAQELHDQIDLESSKRAAQILALYQVATSGEITNLLGKNSDAETLYAQISRKSSNPASIFKLYEDGFTATEITKFLKVAGAKALVAWMQKEDSNYTRGKLLYASGDKGKIGSIYFTNGRIRLVHASGPELAYKPIIHRFTISNSDYAIYQQWRTDNINDPLKEKLRELAAKHTKKKGHVKYLNYDFKGESFTVTQSDLNAFKKYREKNNLGYSSIYDYMQTLGSYEVAQADRGEKLIEFFGKDGEKGMHPSRGGPVSFSIDEQTDLNLIVNIIKAGAKNKQLKAIMEAHPRLKSIPLNSA